MDDKRLDAMEKRMSAGGPNSSNPYKRYFVCLCHSPPWDQSYNFLNMNKISYKISNHLGLLQVIIGRIGTNKSRCRGHLFSLITLHG